MAVEWKEIYREGGTDVAIADGGTGQSTQQAALDALTAVAGATNEHVLTKDTTTGNAIFKAAAGGGGYPYWQILSGETVSVPARQQYSIFMRLDLQGTLSLGAGAELAII